MIGGQRKSGRLRTSRLRSTRRPARRSSAWPRLEPLESRSLLTAAPGLTPDDLAHETLDQAIDLGHVSPGDVVQESGSIGGGPEGAADVEWFSFTLDAPARITWQLTRQRPSSSFNGVLSLFNNDPDDFMDPYDPDGHRLLEQVDGQSDGGVATLSDLLGEGTYYLAVSGDGDFDFYPDLAGSGLPGSTGAFDLQLSLAYAGIGSPTGPQVLTSDPSPGAVLSASPLAIRVDLSGALDPSTIIAGQTVQLIYSPDGDFARDGQQVPLGSVNFSAAVEDSPTPGEPAGTILHYQGANELQLFPASPLLPGDYEVVLQGRSVDGSVALADPDGNPLGAQADDPQGQDVTIPFQVDGIEGRAGVDTEDDTPATAQDLGDLTSAGIVQVAGAIGDDPLAAYAANQVDLYEFSVTGAGNDSLTADVFAGRIGSPLTPGVSLFRLDPADGQLQFIAGDINSYNPTTATDGSTPLYTDSVLEASLTAGVYYLAVADGSNTPSPLEGQPVGGPGIFDPDQPGSAQDGWNTGPYVLNVLVQPAPTPPHVVSTSPAAGSVLDQPPTQLVVTFDQPMNIAQLAFQTYQVDSQDTISSIFIEAAGGTKYFPRLESYDAATDTATFLMLDALPDGAYQLHLSGAAGLADLGGNPLVGNDPGGDYVVPFTVDAPPRGDDGNPLEWSDSDTNDIGGVPQDLGVLFPDELAAGVTITRDFSRDPGQAPLNTADAYEFQVLLNQSYTFSLSGTDLPPGVAMTLTDSSGQSMGFNLGGTYIFAQLTPGTYRLTVSGWNQSEAAGISYQVAMSFDSENDNAPPLLSGPAPAVAIQLDSVAPPTSTAPPPVVTPPVVAPPTPTDPSPAGPPSSGTDPSAPAAVAAAIAMPPLPEAGTAFAGASPLSLVALATTSIGGVIGTGGFQPGSTQLAENSAAPSQSAVVSGLIVLSTSLHVMGPGEGVGAAADGQEAAESPTDVEPPARDAGSSAVTERDVAIAPFLDGLIDLGMRGVPSPSDPKTAAVAAAIPVTPVGREVSSVDEAERSPGSDDEPNRPDRRRGGVFILTFTGLALGVYARCRGLVQRGEHRGERRASAGPGATSRWSLRGDGMGRGDA